eukprot:868030-Prorocentrum_minimum.AAC.2
MDKCNRQIHNQALATMMRKYRTMEGALRGCTICSGRASSNRIFVSRGFVIFVVSACSFKLCFLVLKTRSYITMLPFAVIVFFVALFSLLAFFAYMGNAKGGHVKMGKGDIDIMNMFKTKSHARSD